MTAIPPGVSYESLEDRFLGSALQLMAAQSDPAKNPAPAKTLINTLTFNAATGTYSITATIPCVSSVDANGNIQIDAAETFL